MKTTVSNSDFHDRFRTMGRENQFTYEAKNALFDYLKRYEEDCEQEVELDVIALCCEYDEYEDIEEFWKDYDKETYPTLDDLEDYTTVIRFGVDSFIVQQF